MNFADIRPGDQTPSIMLASYPVYEKEFDDPVAANDYEQIIATVKSSRSLIDAYGLKENAESKTAFSIYLILVKIVVQTQELRSLFTHQMLFISQLIGSKKLGKIQVVTETKEEGYGVSTVNSEISVLLLVKVLS
jgi:valyl-tRNA synthetase